MKRTSLEKADCPVARALDAIGDWWSLLIIRDAFDGMRRFSEFQKNLGMSKGILASRLRDLVRLGILELASASDGGAHKEYTLTVKGQDLFHVIVSLRQWGEKHLYAHGESHSTLVENDVKRLVPSLELRAGDGHTLSWLNTHVEKIPPVES